MKVNKEKVKAKILAVAEEMFLKKGFFPTTVDEIAQKAKVAKGTVYLYFPTKESIYLALFEDKLKIGIEILEKVKNMEISAKEKISLIFDEWFSKIQKAKGLSSFLALENINISPKIILLLRKKIHPKVRKIFLIINEIFQEGIKNKEFKKYDSRLLSIIFLHILQTSLLFFSFNIKEDGRNLKEIFLKGVER